MMAAANGNRPQNVAFSGQSAASLWVCVREYERAESSATEALALSEIHQLPYFAALSRCILGYARAQLGRPTEGIRLIRQGIAGLLEIGSRLAASVADITQLPDLLHGQERELFRDQAYWKEDDRKFLEAWGVRYRINRRPTTQRPLSERWRMINRARSRTRARGEHAFRVVKQLWGFAKVRYRGLAKNLARAQTMFALANLYQVADNCSQQGPGVRCEETLGSKQSR